MNKPKVTLLISGQLSRNVLTNNFLQILQYHYDLFKFDQVICHLWDEEYNQVKHLEMPDNVTILHDDDSLPFNENLKPYIDENEHLFHAESVQIAQRQRYHYVNSNDFISADRMRNKYNDPLILLAEYKKPFIKFGDQDSRDKKGVAFTSLKQLYSLTRVYNYAIENCSSDIYIRARYDNHYKVIPNYDELLEYLKSDRPVAFVPRTHINYSLLDHFYIMNKSALDTFENYFDTCRNYSINDRVFWSENCFRFHANNAKKLILYRFNFPCFVHRYFMNIGDYNCRNFQFTKITRDVKLFKNNGIRSADYIL